MLKRRAILWYRQDLRLHDNEALHDALSSSDDILPVYVFDERVFYGKTKFGFPKTGSPRIKFLLESVLDLRSQLRSRGSDLIVRVGLPEKEIYQIAEEAKTSWVFCNRERTQEEVKLQDSLEKNLWSIGQEVRYSRGKMLFYTADLPFPVTQCPDSYASFRKEVERIVSIRKPLPIPENLPAFTTDIPAGRIPDFSELNVPKETITESSILSGGESSALIAMEKFKESLFTPNNGKPELPGMGLSEDHSGLSAYLSSGCLSPKLVFHKINSIRFQRKKIQKVIQGLIFRDFLRLMGKKHQSRIFSENGINGNTAPRKIDNEVQFQMWAHGKTGVPIVDAIMRKLYQTGLISEKARLIAGRFLVDDLRCDWRMGASWFESRLLDYDPCSNWVNWNILARVGPEVKELRPLNFISLAKRLDPKGEFVKNWLPELKDIEDQIIHKSTIIDKEKLPG